MRSFSKLIQAAKEASVNAYRPYSKFNVGAAALTFDGKIYTGFNVENCGLSLTIHAEQSAIINALADGLLERGKQQGLTQFQVFLAVAVYLPKTKEAWPCTGCRQFMGEFGYDMHVIGEDPDTKNILCLTLGQLVPYHFPIEKVLKSIEDKD